MVSRATNLKAPLRRSVQTTTIHFQQDPSQSNLLRVCRLGSCSQDKISTSLCLSVYGSRSPYAETESTASTACGSWSNKVSWMSLPNSTHLFQMAVTWTHGKLCLLVLIKCKHPWVLILGLIVSSVVQPLFWRQWAARQDLQLHTLCADRQPLQWLVQMHHWTYGVGDKLASSLSRSYTWGYLIWLRMKTHWRNGSILLKLFLLNGYPSSIYQCSVSETTCSCSRRRGLTN